MRAKKNNRRGPARRGRGFTLIELLVVIAIIGILSSVVLASLNSARVKARDARRVADLKQIQIALELYNDAIGNYPTALADIAPTYIAKVPTDPSDLSSYKYAVNSITAATRYHLGANLEQTAAATTLDDNDLDRNSATTGVGALSWPATATSIPFNGADATKCDGTVGMCYDVGN